jgi:hypothetical protein
MTGMIVAVVAVVALGLIGVEAARWLLRPEARRLRVIRKIGNRR